MKQVSAEKRAARGYVSLDGIDVTHIHREWQLTNTFWALLQRLVALVMLILALPLFAVFYVPVRLASRGSFLYKQKRPGFLGREFEIVKIRTMRVDSDRDESLQKGVRIDNPNVTRVGRFLRDTKIDELPQLWNVVRGDMEFVGPRPVAPRLHELLHEKLPGFNRRYLVKPGLTNIGQVSVLENGLGDDTVEDWKLRFEGELHYIRHMSISYDLLLIFMTCVFMGRKALGRLGRRKKCEPRLAKAA